VRISSTFAKSIPELRIRELVAKVENRRKKACLHARDA